MWRLSLVAILCCYVGRLHVFLFSQLANLVERRSPSTRPPRLRFGDACVVWCAGLRGGVAFAIASSSRHRLDFPERCGGFAHDFGSCDYETVENDSTAMLQATMVCIIFTIFVGGGSMPAIARRCGVVESVEAPPLESPFLDSVVGGALPRANEGEPPREKSGSHLEHSGLIDFFTVCGRSTDCTSALRFDPASSRHSLVCEHDFEVDAPRLGRLSLARDPALPSPPRISGRTSSYDYVGGHAYEGGTGRLSSYFGRLSASRLSTSGVAPPSWDRSAAQLRGSRDAVWHDRFSASSLVALLGRPSRPPPRVPSLAEPSHQTIHEGEDGDEDGDEDGEAGEGPRQSFILHDSDDDDGDDAIGQGSGAANKTSRAAVAVAAIGILAVLVVTAVAGSWHDSRRALETVGLALGATLVLCLAVFGAYCDVVYGSDTSGRLNEHSDMLEPDEYDEPASTSSDDARARPGPGEALEGVVAASRAAQPTPASSLQSSLTVSLVAEQAERELTQVGRQVSEHLGSLGYSPARVAGRRCSTISRLGMAVHASAR